MCLSSITALCEKAVQLPDCTAHFMKPIRGSVRPKAGLPPLPSESLDFVASTTKPHSSSMPCHDSALHDERRARGDEEEIRTSGGAIIIDDDGRFFVAQDVCQANRHRRVSPRA